MNIDKILEKLSDFCLNYAVAAFAVAAFQKNVPASVPGIISLLFALLFISQTEKKT